MTRTGSLETQLSLDAAMVRIEDSKWKLGAEYLMFHSGFFFPEGFTSDDLRERLGDPPGSGCALGALLSREVRAGRLLVVGRRKSTRPDRHRARLNVYQAKEE